MLNNYLLKIDSNTKINDEMNVLKSKILEEKKPSLKEEIVYFKENELDNIKNGFSNGTLEDIKAKPYIEKRSLLEHLPMQRHPIPYMLVRYVNDKTETHYFFLFRESGSTETRLIGKKGLPGGHVDGVDALKDKNGDISLKDTLEIGMYRELEEEVGIPKNEIKNIEFVGYIKEMEERSVGYDHLGLVYIIDVAHMEYTSMEEGIISGTWLRKENIKIEELESWAQLVYENIIL